MTLHLANVHFEQELSGKTFPPNLISRQLQFLPLLYIDPEDGIAVSDLPHPLIDRNFHLLSSEHKLEYDRLETWGYSLEAKKWAEKRGLRYEMPPWEVVHEVNSKEFSWKESPQLLFSGLFRNEKEVYRWIEQVKGPKVLKTCFGLSGKGHLLLPVSEHRLSQFLQREFALGLPVIGEPWVERELDFSTQWMIYPDQRIELIAPTILVTTSHGQHVENRVGNIAIPKLEEHLSVAHSVLKKLARKGFFGNVGVDAMLYEGGKLHPIVEINARKTMGWVCAKYQHRYFPKQTVSLRYMPSTSAHSLLPKSIIQADGKIVDFTRQLLDFKNASR